MKRLKPKAIEINIDQQQDFVLRNLTKKKGIPKAEIILKGLARFLREIPLEKDPGMGLIGLGNSGKRNLSDSHDKCLARYTKQKKR